MKTKDKNKEFDTVKTFRKIKEEISKEIESMSHYEIKAYLKRESKKL